MRQLLPGGMETSRAKTIRWHLYSMSAKIIKTGRQVFVKVQAQHQTLLDEVVTAILHGQIKFKQLVK